MWPFECGFGALPYLPISVIQKMHAATDWAIGAANWCQRFACMRLVWISVRSHSPSPPCSPGPGHWCEIILFYMILHDWMRGCLIIRDHLWSHMIIYHDILSCMDTTWDHSNVITDHTSTYQGPLHTHTPFGCNAEYHERNWLLPYLAAWVFFCKSQCQRRPG